MKTYEVKYTIYENKDHTSALSELQWLSTFVNAVNSQTAQSMIEAQYQGLAQVLMVTEHS
jgi:hypothetical protein